MEDKDLDQLFREAFNEAQETPSSKVWTNIDANLTEAKPIISIQTRRNYWSYAAAAVLLIALGSYWGISLNNKKEITAPVSEQTITKSTTEIQQIENLKSDINVSPNHYDRKIVETMSHKSIIRKKESDHKQTNVSQRTLIQIEAIPESKLTLSSLELNTKKHELPSIRQVTEIDDIKPLIEFDEEPETMLASSNKDENKNIISTVLNKISENLDPQDNKGIRFVVDEEGSFGINIINSIAKNRNKKRK